MASLALLQRVLTWAAEQGMSVREQLSEEQIVALERVFRGAEPWSFDQYQQLRFFAHALSRLDVPDLPAHLSFGDILDALDELRSATVAAWPAHAAITDSTLRELGYTSISAGITRLRDANKPSWREHAAANRQFVLRAAERAVGSRAVVVGAGKLYDIPLRQLAERFEQVLLVDIDAAAMAESVETVGLEPALRARVSLFQADVTGISDVFLERARAALSFPGEVQVYAALLELLRSYRVDEPPRLLPEGAAAGPLDFASSSMVLSQLAAPLTQYVETQFARRFPSSERTRAWEFQVALGQFSHRVQHAHVRSLLAAAPWVALSSDIAEQYVGLDAHGNLLQGAEFMALIGASSLAALVPRQHARVVFGNEWQWRHVVPTRSKPHGRTAFVAGVVVERC